MNYIVENYIEYQNRDDDEILTFNEWVFLEKKRYSGKMREFESTGRKVWMYGLAVFFGGAIGAVIMMAYRYYTDKCRKECKTETQKERCYVTCYHKASSAIVKLIQKDYKKLSTIEDPKKRESVKRKLDSELDKWKTKRDEYGARLKRK